RNRYTEIVIRILGILLASVLLAQTPQPALQTLQPLLKEPPPVEWVCPMDHDIRSSGPGKCPRCGITMVPGIPDQVEYPVALKLTPRNFHAGQKGQLEFDISDPKTGQRV